MLSSPRILPAHLLRYGTFCSGIEAVSVAWDGLGWHPVFFSEIDRFACAVLKARHPHVPNIGDMTRVNGESLQGLLDIIVAGTPCQSFSIAGLRTGLSDERGNLTLELVKIYVASKTAYLLWENVPGVLSDRGNAFGCFLGALSGENEALLPPGGRWTDAGYVLGPQRTIAWVIKDAQYFGLAQRRRRVFLVAGPRDGADPRQILFEFGGMRRDSPPCREKAQDIAGALEASIGRSRGAGTSPAAITVGRKYVPDIVGQAMTCKWSKGTSGPAGDEHHNLVAYAVRTAQTSSNGWGVQEDVTHTLDTANAQAIVAVRDDVALALRAEGHDASEDGTGRQNLVVMPINTQVGLRHHALGERTGLGIGDNGSPALTLQGAHGHAVAILPSVQASAVRRLTPLECERLQGFPDGYTALTNYPAWRDLDEHENPEELSAAGYKVRRTKKGAWRVNDPDGPRYKALGNSMAVDVMRWLGMRLKDAIQEGRG